MKTIFALLSLIVAYAFGSVIGASFGFMPVESGLVAAVGTILAVRPAGVLSAGPDISEVTSQLGAYVKANMGTIWSKIREGMQLKQYMSTISGVTGKWTGFTGDITELHQSYQKGFQAKGTPSIAPFINENFHVKVDTLLDDMHVLWNGWLNWLADEQKTPDQWPFVQYVVYDLIVPKMIEEINSMHCVANYVAPTPGTANTALQSMNGLFTLVTDIVTAGDLSPITVGAASSANAVTKFETFVSGIADKYKNGGGVILTSVANQANYKAHYRTLFGATNDQASKNKTTLDFNPNIEIVGLTGATSVNRMLFVPGDPKRKLVHLINQIGGPDRFSLQLFNRDVKVLHDRWDGVGFTNLDGIHVSDVA